MPKARPKKPVIALGPITIRAVAGEPGAWRWRAEWYPPGRDGKMSTRSLSRVRGERFDRDEAIARAADLLGEGVHLSTTGTPAPEQRTVETVLDLLEAWLGHQRSRVGATIRQSTYVTYRVHVRALSALHVVELPLAELSPNHLLRVLGSLRARYSDQTTHMRMITFRAACQWGAAAGALPELQWPEWRPERPVQHMPSLDDVLETLRALEALGPDRLRNSYRKQTILAVELMLHTGARPGECSLAHRHDFDANHLVWRVRGGAGSKTGPREVPVGRELVSRIHQRPEGPLFPPLQSQSTTRWNAWIRTGADKAGVQRWTCKGLRHLAVTRMLNAGIDVKTAASITGHSPVVLLRSYAHALDSSRRRASDLLATIPRGTVVPFPKKEIS